jgi:hypothetical protein
MSSLFLSYRFISVIVLSRLVPSGDDPAFLRLAWRYAGLKPHLHSFGEKNEQQLVLGNLDRAAVPQNFSRAMSDKFSFQLLVNLPADKNSLRAHSNISSPLPVTWIC